MHIHGHSMAVNPADFYAAAQGRKADQAQRAAETRKKLLKGTAETEGTASDEESLLIGQWMNSGHGQVRSQNEAEDEYSSGSYGSEGRDADFD